MLNWTKGIKNLRYKDWVLLLLILFCTFLMGLPSTCALPITDECSLVEGVDWWDSGITAENYWNKSAYGHFDCGQFYTAQLRLLSQSDPQWLQYNLKYIGLLINPPIFTPAGLLQISRQSITAPSTLTTPYLTFQANTSQGLTTNTFYMNSSLLTSNPENLQFSVRCSKAFIHGFPWGPNQPNPSGLWSDVSHTEPWTPLLNFSSRSVTLPLGEAVKFAAGAKISTHNYTIKCTFVLYYTQVTGVLQEFYFIFQKSWNESNTLRLNLIQGDIVLKAVNFTSSIPFSEFNQSNSVSSDPVTFLSGCLALILLFLLARRKFAS